MCKRNSLDRKGNQQGICMRNSRDIKKKKKKEEKKRRS